MKRYGLTLLALVVIAALPSHALVRKTVSPPPDLSGLPPHVPGEILVRFKDAAGARAPVAASLERLHAGHGLQRMERLFPEAGASSRRAAARLPATARLRRGLDRTYRLVFDRGADVRRLVEAYRGDPHVAYAEPNFLYRAAVFPNDPYYHSFGSWGQQYADLWGIKRIRSGSAWSLSQGRGVVVAVIDTGVDYRHEDLAANIWRNPGEIPGNGRDDDVNGYVDDVQGWDFANWDDDPVDDHGHGTHCAGTIGAAGNNGRGVIGVAPRVKIMALKGLAADGTGSLAFLAAAVRYAADNGADVLSSSWGAFSESRTLADVFAYAHALGCINVAAAGNDGIDVAYFTPASLATVIAVAALDTRNNRAPFSNWGDKIDVSAPGTEVLSLRARGTDMYRGAPDYKPGERLVPAFTPAARYYRASGTSMACPHAAGVAALVRSRHPSYGTEELRHVLRSTAEPHGSPGVQLGTGRVNAAAAAALDIPPLTVELEAVAAAPAGVVQVKGTAKGGAFLDYSLSYGEGSNPTTWTELFGALTPVDRGVLMDGFDTRQLPDGRYKLRLVARNRRGMVNETRVPLVVEGVVLASPLDNDILRPGESVGVAGDTGDSTLTRVEHGAGFEPSRWSTQGVALTGNATGVLARWDTSGLETGFHTLRLTVDTPYGPRRKLVGMLYMDTRLKPGWPRHIPVDGLPYLNDWQDVVVADLDGDGDSEVIALQTQPSRLLVYDHAGALLWSQDALRDAVFFDTPTVGDLDGDGRKEVLVCNGHGLLFAFRHDGTPLSAAWPRPLGLAYAKIAADLDGDGRDELVTRAVASVVLADGSKPLLILDGSGAVLAAIKTPTDLFDGGRDVFPVVGNFDDDGDLEIATKYGPNGVAVYDRDGSLLPGWPVMLPIGHIWHSPAAGDVDGDGRDDLVVPGEAEYGKADTGLFVLDRAGRVLPGWPVLTGLSLANGLTSPALADLDGDGRLEICVAHGSDVHLFRDTGEPVAGWPRAAFNGDSRSVISWIRESCTIGDVDGDGAPDVLVAGLGFSGRTMRTGDPVTSGGIFAWRADGSRIDLNPDPRVFSLFMEEDADTSVAIVGPRKAPLTLADIDGNGRLDIVASALNNFAFHRAGGGRRKNRHSLYAWELDVPYRADRAPWPMFLHDPGHSGRSRR